MNADLEKLHAPIPHDRIKWRIGSTTSDKKRGLALAYIDARVVQDRLDEAVGPENWQSELTELPSGVFICRLGIWIDSDWVWKSDGAGKTDIEGEKGACSDALKRAAVSWGIGRELYDLESFWVEIEPAGRSYKIKQNQYALLVNSLTGYVEPDAPSDAPGTELDDNEQDAVRREDLFDQLKDFVELNGLNKEYVWYEMRCRVPGAIPTTEELAHQVKHLAEHPDLWRKPEPAEA